MKGTALEFHDVYTQYFSVLPHWDSMGLNVKRNRTQPKKGALYFGRTKESKLRDFPGVNAPLVFRPPSFEAARFGYKISSPLPQKSQTGFCFRF